MSEFKGNSDRSKNKPGRDIQVKPLEKGSAEIKQATGWQKFKRNFFGMDKQEVSEYALFDILVPAAKKAVVEVVNIILYGRARGGNFGGTGQSVSYRQYSDVYGPDPRDRRRNEPSYSRRLTPDDISFTSREAAEDALAQMLEIIEVYGVVTVAKFFEIAGIRDDNYTNHNIGWFRIPNNPPQPIGGGDYILDLPRPTTIKNF